MPAALRPSAETGASVRCNPLEPLPNAPDADVCNDGKSRTSAMNLRAHFTCIRAQTSFGSTTLRFFFFILFWPFFVLIVFVSVRSSGRKKCLSPVRLRGNGETKCTIAEETRSIESFERDSASDPIGVGSRLIAVVERSRSILKLLSDTDRSVSARCRGAIQRARRTIHYDSRGAGACQ